MHIVDLFTVCCFVIIYVGKESVNYFAKKESIFYVCMVNVIALGVHGFLKI